MMSIRAWRDDVSALCRRHFTAEVIPQAPGTPAPKIVHLVTCRLPNLFDHSVCSKREDLKKAIEEVLRHHYGNRTTRLCLFWCPVTCNRHTNNNLHKLKQKQNTGISENFGIGGYSLPTIGPIPTIFIHSE